METLAKAWLLPHSVAAVVEMSHGPSRNCSDAGTASLHPTHPCYLAILAVSKRKWRMGIIRHVRHRMKIIWLLLTPYATPCLMRSVAAVQVGRWRRVVWSRGALEVFWKLSSQEPNETTPAGAMARRDQLSRHQFGPTPAGSP